MKKPMPPMKKAPFKKAGKSPAGLRGAPAMLPGMKNGGKKC